MDFKLNIKFDDSKAIRGLSKIDKSIEGLQKESKQLGSTLNGAFDSTPVKKLDKGIDGLDETVKKTNKDLKEFARLTSKEIPEGTNQITSNLDKLVKVGAAVGVVVGSLALGQAVLTASDELQKLKGSISDVFDLEGEELNKLTVKVKTVADATGEESNELIVSAKRINEEFAGAFDDIGGVFDKLNKDIKNNLNINNDYIATVKEYSSQYAAFSNDAKSNSDALFQDIELSVKFGLDLDKLADTRKELNLRLSDIEKEQTDAIDGVLGKTFRDSIIDDNNKIKQSVSETVKAIAKEANNQDLDNTELTKLITAISGGAGENLGIRGFKLLGEDIDQTTEKLTLLKREQNAQLKINESLAIAQLKLSDSIQVIKTGLTELVATNIDEYFAIIQKASSEAWATIGPVLSQIRIEFNDKIKPALIKLIDVFSNLQEKVQGTSNGLLKGVDKVKLFRGVVSAMSTVLTKAIETLSFLANAVIDVASPIVDVLQPAIASIIESFETAFDAISNLNTESLDTGETFKILGEAIGKAIKPFALFIEYTAKLTTYFIDLSNEGGIVSDMFNSIIDAAKNTLNPLQNVYNKIMAIGQALGLVESEAEKAIAEQNKQLAQSEQDDMTRMLDASKQANQAFRKDESDKAKEAAEKTTKTIEKNEVKRTNIVKSETAKRSKENDKAAKELQKIQEAYERIYETLQGKADAAELDKLTGVDKLKEIRKRAYEEIEILKQTVEEKAKEAGKEIDIAKEINELKLQAERDYLKQLEQLRKSDKGGENAGGGTLESSAGLVSSDDASVFAKDAVNKINNAVVAETKKTNPFESIFDKIKDSLNISDEEAEMLMGGIGEIYTNVNSIISDLNDIAIDKNNKYIDSLNDKINATENALNKELELQKEGFANNVDLERQRLEELKKQQEKALKEKEKLEAKQRRAAKIQRQIDTAGQAVGLISASVDIFKTYSKIPFGTPIAIAMIATMMTAFAASKIKAEKLAKVKLFRGGLLPNGRTDKYGGEGRRIEGTNIVVGGGEYVVNEDSTRKNTKFLNRFNGGEFDGMDLSKAIDNGLNLKANLTIVKESKTNNQSNLSRLETKFDKLAELQTKTNDSLNRLYTRTDYVGTDNGYMKIERNKTGSTNIVKTVKSR